MAKHPLKVVSLSVEAEPIFTFEEFCIACNSSPDFIREVIEYGVLEVEPAQLNVFQFEIQHLRKVRTVVRLQKDLEVNLAGAALVVELMDTMDQMRARLEWLEKHWRESSSGRS